MYTIVEMQTDANGHTEFITSEKATRPLADSDAYSKLASVALSTVLIHTVQILDETQTVVFEKRYDRRQNGGGN